MGNLCVPCNQYEDATTPSSANRYYDSALDEFDPIANSISNGFDNGVGNGNNPLEDSYHVPSLEFAIPTLHVSPRLSARTCEAWGKAPAQVPCSESTATGCNKSNAEVLSSRGLTRKSTPKSTPRQPFPSSRQNTLSTPFHKSVAPSSAQHLHARSLYTPPRRSTPPSPKYPTATTPTAPHPHMSPNVRQSRRPSCNGNYTPTKAMQHYSPRRIASPQAPRETTPLTPRPAAYRGPDPSHVSTSTANYQTAAERYCASNGPRTPRGLSPTCAQGSHSYVTSGEHESQAAPRSRGSTPRAPSVSSPRRGTSPRYGGSTPRGNSPRAPCVSSSRRGSTPHYGGTPRGSSSRAPSVSPPRRGTSPRYGGSTPRGSSPRAPCVSPPRRGSSPRCGASHSRSPRIGRPHPLTFDNDGVLLYSQGVCLCLSLGSVGALICTNISHWIPKTLGWTEVGGWGARGWVTFVCKCVFHPCRRGFALHPCRRRSGLRFTPATRALRFTPAAGALRLAGAARALRFTLAAGALRLCVTQPTTRCPSL